MSTVMTFQTDTTSSVQTEKLGELLGKQLKGGEVFELASDLGGGKTTFVRGLARGFGSSDHVASPTFTINRQYRAGASTLYHYDFYRLSDAGTMHAELAEEIDEPGSVVVVEWPEVVKDVLPDIHIELFIDVVDEDIRRLRFKYPEPLEYVFELARTSEDY